VAPVSADAVLVVNAGSTSLKLHVVDCHERSRPIAESELRAAHPRAVAHRVVHGGVRLHEPVVIDEQVRELIFALEPLAPLHNAPALRAIEHTMKALPEVPHVAVFDTGFHRTMPVEASTYALPRRFRERWGVRRYGFHGLSLQWCAERAPQLLHRPAAQVRLVVCHLGGGCSVSALRDGRSLDTTMGFSPLEGVPMGTRSGSIDPGALIYLLRERGLSVGQLDRALNCDSGLRGLAGGSGNMQDVERAAGAGEAGAQLALDVFAHRVAGAVGTMAVACEGLDALVFTGGIGERSALVRERICARLCFLGVQLDQERNRAEQPAAATAAATTTTTTDPADRDIGARGSAVRVLVVHAREELIAARAARALLGLLAGSRSP
jgi:acetate kinase